MIGVVLLGLLPSPPAELRYSLKPGTRLVYEERLEQSREGPNESLLVRAAWRTQVLVLGDTVGFERNRTKAELVRDVQDGRDERAREASSFEALVATRPVRFAEANRLDPFGFPRLPWGIHREWPSQVLYEVHEIEPLPQGEASGVRSSPGTALGLRFEALGKETVLGRECIAIGAEAPGTLKLRFHFSPELHALVHLQMDGNYSVYGQRVHETLELSLVEAREAETLDHWLEDPETQVGALAALLVSEKQNVDRQTLDRLFEGGAPDLDRAALALLYRAHLSPPPSPALARLLRPESGPRLRSLALRSLEGTPPNPAVRAAIEEGLAAPSDEVRTAALHYVTERLPIDAAAGATGPEALGHWETLHPLPLPREGSDFVRAVEGTGPLPEWTWGAPERFSERCALAKRSGAPAPGFTLRTMETPPYGGWPYIVRVPEEYRGDEPFPLIVMLGGGPGRALEGALSVGESLEKTPALCLFPQAQDLWWEPRSLALLPVLLKEFLRSFNVDTNRVYLMGFSNGGTGTFKNATLWPDRLAAAVSLMGAGPFVTGGSPAPLTSNLGGLPLLFLHGDADPIIPTRASVETVAQVRKEAPDAHVELEILKGVGHEITLAREGERVFSFLDGRRRNPFPRKVHLAITDLSFPRRFWVRVLEKEGGTAEVSGLIGDDGVIALETRKVRRLELLLRRELLPKGSFEVRLNGKPSFSGTLTEDRSLLIASYRESVDPFLAYSMSLVLTP